MSKNSEIFQDIDNVELRENFLVIHYTQGETIELNLSRSSNGERRIRFRGTDLQVAWSQQTVVIESNDIKLTIPRVSVSSSSSSSTPTPPSSTPSSSSSPSSKPGDSKFLEVV